MSRSYKKHPIVKDGGPKRVKYAKKLSNKKVRRANLPGGKSNLYKRVMEPYDIHDYRMYCTKKEIEDGWDREETVQCKYDYYHRRYKTKMNCIQKVWYKHYKRK